MSQLAFLAKGFDKGRQYTWNVLYQKFAIFGCFCLYTDEEAVFLAHGAGIDPEIALLGCHADRNENPAIKSMWESIAKKYNGLGLSSISMVCAGLALVIASPQEPLLQCALYVLC
ncbi:hypothetical protein FT122_05780 [Vibrio alginolyticus]|nr:hypothetical protein [Vibrio alginolyticus]